MLTAAQINAILAWPGTYTYWCVTTPTGDPFWAHTRVGKVLHVVTAQERAAMRDRARH